jgi:predicted DNA-binding protein
MVNTLTVFFQSCQSNFCTCFRAQIDQKERKAAQRHDRLEAELNNYKTNLIKESIRMGHNDMGDFYYGRGDLQVSIAKCPQWILSALAKITL